MIIRHRFRTEARVNIGAAVFMMGLMSLSLSGETPTPSVLFIGVFDVLGAIWILLNLGYGTLTMGDGQLVVRSYVRSKRLPFAEVARFGSVIARRGIGHRREILTAERRSGEVVRFDPINASPSSDRIGDVVSELNAALQEWAQQEETGRSGALRQA